MKDDKKQNSITVFYSYEKTDQVFRDQLAHHLGQLKRDGLIKEWYDQQILAGSNLTEEINQAIDSAQIILLLMSAEFLSSDACYREMQRALEHHQRGKAHVIPIIVRQCDWSSSPIGALQCLPRNKEPISTWSDRDQAFLEVAKELRRIIAQTLPSSLLSDIQIQKHENLMEVVIPKNNTPSYFISYAREDSEFVETLKIDLEKQRISTWLDKIEIRLGRDWQEEIREVIRVSSGIIYVASPSARRSQYVKGELAIADIYQCPVYPFWIQGQNWMEAAPLNFAGMHYLDAREKRYTQALDALVKELNIPKDIAQTRPVSQDFSLSPSYQPRNPYKGLEAFKLEDAKDFFGREQLTHKIVEHLRGLLNEERQGQLVPRLLAIIGASGSGKSSVIMAGLLPSLQQGALLGSQEWVYLKPMHPGPKPLEALAETLSAHFPEISRKSILDAVKGPYNFHRFLASLTRSRGITKVILFVDQFEELFKQDIIEEERKLFLDLLIATITEPGGSVIVLLTLRADFYDRPLQHIELGQLIAEHHITMLPMTLQELRKAIEKPTQLPDVQLHFEDGLVEDLLFDIWRQPGTLPLLQFTLEQLFEQRDSLQLTNRAYNVLGGVRGALAKQAEETYKSLPSEHKRLARALFLRLIDINKIDQNVTKRRVALSELRLSDPKETGILEMVLDKFIDKRLLTISDETGNLTPTIEISHEALIHAWERLENWVEEPQTYLNTSIRNDVADWIRHDKNVEQLYKGNKLAEARNWKMQNIPSREEAEFLQISIQQQQYRITRRTFLASFAGLGFVISTIALSRLLPPEKTVAIWTFPYIYKGHYDKVTSVSWSPDGKHIASGSYDQTVQVWEVSTGKLLLKYTEHSDAVNSVSWSPDGKYVASGSNDKTVRVWNADIGGHDKVYEGHKDSVTSVSWSPDGKYVASGSDDQTVQVWDASTEKLLLKYTGHDDAVNCVAWSPNGKHVASGSDDQTVQVWDASTKRLLLKYTGHSEAVNCVLWSPNGENLASGSDDRTVQVWASSTGTLFQTYENHSDAVNCVSWSPNSEDLASGSDDRTVQVWNFSFTNAILICKGHRGPVLSVTWSPDGKHIASGSVDHGIQVWEVSSERLFHTYEDNSIYKNHNAYENIRKFAIKSVAWSPDGKYLASGSDDHIVQVWETISGILFLSYKNHLASVNSIAWSPDGKKIASGSDDQTVQVWEASTKKLLLTYQHHRGAVKSVSWSPDGKKIASGSDDQTVQIWDETNAMLFLTYQAVYINQKLVLGHQKVVNCVAWSPDGKRIASGSDDQTVQIWEADTGQILQKYLGHSEAVNCVAWSPDGKRIASGSDDQTVQIWEADTGKLLQTYEGHKDSVQSVSWSPDGKRIASGSNDQTAQVWSANF